ncbi:MAG: large subunit ribosomal protein [Gaiellales bacterium]|jgi:large subunit ribosomal protein L15|nr:large subunit ribosomal protein [Gaiellales bacterium]
MAEELNLHTLQPAEGSHRERKRVGRGHGSGNGKTSGRGQKGQKSRAGSHSMRPGFEGGQMPLYMRLGKLRGPNHKKSMPLGPFRTFTTPVNVRELERFDAGAEITPELLKQAGVVRSLKHPIKILASGELTKKLTVQAHGFSAKAVEVIEAAGGTVVRLAANGKEQAADIKDPKRRTTKAAAAQAEVEAPVADKPQTDEASAEPEVADDTAADAGDEPASAADGTEEETE